MNQINIDIETYSDIDLQKSGVYKYADSKNFEILLIGYSINKGPVRVVDIGSGEKVPEDFMEAISSASFLKYAFNAQFERVCLSRYLDMKLDPELWRCTMVASLYLGLPGSLQGVGEVMRLGKQKMTEGKNLIRLFSVPQKPSKANHMKNRIYPSDAPIEWKTFMKYNARDVETELEIGEKLSRFPVPDKVWTEYAMDQRINDRGVAIDLTLASQSIRCDEKLRNKYLSRAQELTGLDNPNSPLQLKEWFLEQGVAIGSLSKKDVSDLIGGATGDAREVLELRQLLSKSSVKKYAAMEACCCKDGRAHGLLQFYGANRTGRWAGRLIQVQNLPQNHVSDLKTARDLIRGGFFDAAEMIYDSVPDLLSQLIRTAFVPKNGCKFMVADFSAIEARVLSWIAGEEWRMKVFEGNGDIYCASASQMFHCKVEKHGENSELRPKGKIAELALGYGGSIGALTAMGALDMGVKEEELQPLVDSWRKTNPRIVKFWWEVDKAVISAVRDKKPSKLKGMTFRQESGFLIITLLSGRELFYAHPVVDTNAYGRSSVTYEGTSTGKHWMRIESYGPKFVENIIQATARDILAEAMQRLEMAGLDIVMHVHDEAVIEAPKEASLDEACRIMSETPAFAPGLVLNAAGYECDFYQKD